MLQHIFCPLKKECVDKYKTINEIRRAILTGNSGF